MKCLLSSSSDCLIWHDKRWVAKSEAVGLCIYFLNKFLFKKCILYYYEYVDSELDK